MKFDVQRRTGGEYNCDHRVKHIGIYYCVVEKQPDAEKGSEVGRELGWPQGVSLIERIYGYSPYHSKEV
jgi:hypothetical protein